MTNATPSTFECPCGAKIERQTPAAATRDREIAAKSSIRSSLPLPLFALFATRRTKVAVVFRRIQRCPSCRRLWLIAWDYKIVEIVKAGPGDG